MDLAASRLIKTSEPGACRPLGPRGSTGQFPREAHAFPRTIHPRPPDMAPPSTATPRALTPPFTPNGSAPMPPYQPPRWSPLSSSRPITNASANFHRRKMPIFTVLANPAKAALATPPLPGLDGHQQRPGQTRQRRPHRSPRTTRRRQNLHSLRWSTSSERLPPEHPPPPRRALPRQPRQRHDARDAVPCNANEAANWRTNLQRKSLNAQPRHQRQSRPWACAAYSLATRPKTGNPSPSLKVADLTAIKNPHADFLDRAKSTSPNALVGQVSHHPSPPTLVPPRRRRINKTPLHPITINDPASGVAATLPNGGSGTIATGTAPKLFITSLKSVKSTVAE